MTNKSIEREVKRDLVEISLTHHDNDFGAASDINTLGDFLIAWLTLSTFHSIRPRNYLRLLCIAPRKQLTTFA